MPLVATAEPLDAHPALTHLRRWCEAADEQALEARAQAWAIEDAAQVDDLWVQLCEERP